MVDDEHADVPAAGAAMASRMMWLSALGTPAAGSSRSRTSGLEPERDGELDQALAAVGQLGDALARVVAPASERLQQVHRLVDHVAAAAGGPEHRRGGAAALGDREVDVLQHR